MVAERGLNEDDGEVRSLLDFLDVVKLLIDNLQVLTNRRNILIIQASLLGQ